MASKTTDGSITFAAPPTLVQLVDIAAEKDMLTRSAWLRRTIAQAASARVREPEIMPECA